MPSAIPSWWSEAPTPSAVSAGPRLHRRFSHDWGAPDQGELPMHHQRHLTQDSVLRMQIAMTNLLTAEQSAAIARAHSAIERAMQSLREPDGDVLSPAKSMTRTLL